MPWHEFLSVDARLHPPADYMHFTDNVPEDAASLSDDMYHYMNDTFAWIPSRNPAGEAKWPGYGLNTYGPTVITRAGAPIAQAVFSHWADLFSVGPERFTLVHGVASTEGLDDFRWNRWWVQRDELAETLRNIATMAERALDDNWYLLHLGI